jgi:hypothetical protein
MVTLTAISMASPAVDTLRPSVVLSRWLVFLLAIRPPLNQLRGDTSLFSLGDYNVSVLSLWSIAFLYVALARFRHEHRALTSVRRTIYAFLGVVVIFGVPRIYMREALIYDVLTFVQFFLMALTARGVIDDVGIDYVLRRVSLGAALLVAMHATAALWLPNHDLTSADVAGNYIGAFESKHVAGATFFCVLPYLICAALRDRRSLGAYLIVPTALFLVLALQRVSILSAILLGAAIVVLGRRIKVLVPLAIVGVLVVAVIPSDRFQNFVDSKIEEDVESYRSGDLEEVGAGRMGIIFLAETWFLDDSDFFEQSFGRGTAQAYQLHLIVVGHVAYAHLEFVELIIDYGIVGTGLVFLVFFLIGRAKLSEYRENRLPEHLVGLGMCVVVFAQLFFAMPLQDGGTVTLLAFWLFTPRERELARPDGDVPAQ